MPLNFRWTNECRKNKVPTFSVGISENRTWLSVEGAVDNEVLAELPAEIQKEIQDELRLRQGISTSGVSFWVKYGLEIFRGNAGVLVFRDSRFLQKRRPVLYVSGPGWAVDEFFGVAVGITVF